MTEGINWHKPARKNGHLYRSDKRQFAEIYPNPVHCIITI
jgi:hypothetical protein